MKDPNAKKTETKKNPEIGDTMKDGTIYAGMSPDTGRALYVLPQDAPGTLKWKSAMKYAENLDANGHRDWRPPTKAELNLLHKSRNKGALKGTFNELKSDSKGYYWSLTEHSFGQCYAHAQRFKDGKKYWNHKDIGLSFRPVRSEPRRR